MKKIAVSCAICFPIAFSSAQIVNGGFETGNFSGWTTTPATTGTSLFGVDNLDPHTGTFGAFFGANGTDNDWIRQNVSTINGQAYQLSLWVRDLGPGNSDVLTIRWNSATLYNANVPFASYTQLTFNVFGAAGTTLLEIGARNAEASTDIDDVQLTQVVPEPASCAVIAIGLVAATRRRRR